MPHPDHEIAGVTTLPFEPAEYRVRLEAVRAEMERRDISLLVVTDPSNMNWLTGYDAWSFYSHQAVLIAHDHDPVWWGRALDVVGARLTTWLANESVIGFPESLVQSAEHHPHSELGRVISGLLDPGDTVGVELDNYYYSAAAHRALTAELPGVATIDATGLVNWCRAVKTPAEIGYMRAAARIVERVHERIEELIEPGLPRHLLAAAISEATITGTPEHPGDYPAIVPLMPTGTEAAAPHLTWDGRPFVAGETTFVEIAGCARRYHAPLSRSYHLGSVPSALRRAEAAVCAALEAGIDTARPGTPTEAVAAAVFDTMAERGFERGGRCGYPVGLSYPPDWGERTFSLRDGDRTLLEPGMTLHLMPVLWSAEIAIGITETILVTGDGPADSLTHHPRRLFVTP